MMIFAAVVTGCGTTSEDRSAASIVPSSAVSVSPSSAPVSATAHDSAAHDSAVPSSSRGLEVLPFTDTAHPPPYVAYVEWVSTEVGPSLQIHPTANGRRSGSDDGAQVAWAEVLALEPDADTPGMQAQFDCHWTFARLVEPDKPSWNIEPDRPVVTEKQMIESRCNPGAPEE